MHKHTLNIKLKEYPQASWQYIDLIITKYVFDEGSYHIPNPRHKSFNKLKLNDH